MSTPEQPGSPPLTRRRMREIRNTGATPIITPDDLVDLEQTTESATPAPPAAAPLARAAEPVAVPEAPAPDSSVDLGVSPLTRRQARQQERIRTASVPVITPDLLAAHTAQAPTPIDSVPSVFDTTPATEQAQETDQAPEETLSVEQLLGAPADESDAPAVDSGDAETSEAVQAPDATPPLFRDAPEPETADSTGVSSEVETVEAESDDASRAVVSPQLGADLLGGEPVAVTLPPTFDQLLSHSTSGSTATPNALIMSQGAGSSPLVGPVAATGEVLITGTFNLPEGLGSLGHTAATADGKDVDAVLVDGELPAHSSPTPIAASAAISTVKNSGEIIKPPLPEKGNRLMVSLAITAGVLAAALLGVLVVAMISGVF